MKKLHRLKYEMFVRVKNFGVANREAFPEESGIGKKFGQLAVVATLIGEQLVRHAAARADARKVRLATRKTAAKFIKAIAATGRRVVADETGPHPFRLPNRSAATEVLATARLFKEEAERRKEQFVELGMPPAFLTDFSKAIDDLANAVGVQQDSRAARGKAQGAIQSALSRGTKIVADLDVAVPNRLEADLSKLLEWEGARRVDHPSEEATVPESVPSAETLKVA